MIIMPEQLYKLVPRNEKNIVSDCLWTKLVWRGSWSWRADILAVSYQHTSSFSNSGKETKLHVALLAAWWSDELNSQEAVSLTLKWMCDCVQSGKQSQYITNYQCQLSLSSLWSSQIEYQFAWLELRQYMFTWLGSRYDTIWQVMLLHSFVVIIIIIIIISVELIVPFQVIGEGHSVSAPSVSGQQRHDATDAVCVSPIPHYWESSYNSLLCDMSAEVSVSCSVPQSSVLGPRLFVLYMADLTDVVDQHNMKFHSYADDSQMYVHSQRHNSVSTISRLGHCVADIGH